MSIKELEIKVVLLYRICLGIAESDSTRKELMTEIKGTLVSTRSELKRPVITRILLQAL